MQSAIDFATRIPTDWIIIVLLIIFIAFDVIRGGSSRAVALSLALPLSALLASRIPDTVLVSSIAQSFTTSTMQALFIGVIIAIALVLTYRLTATFGDDSGKPIQALIAGIATVAIVLSVWIQTPALDTLWHFGTQVQIIFGSAYSFFWLCAGYFLLAFVRRSA